MLKLIKIFMTFFAVLSLFMATGCSSNRKAVSEPVPEVSDSEDDSSGNDDLMIYSDSDSGSAGSLKTVNFAYNSSMLSDESRSILDDNASFLKENPQVSIQIEGHCDERGGVQYNLALGEKRANAVRDYLVAMGVASANISTISLGKERPLAFGHDESTWSKNRRANFIITGK